MKFAKSKAVFAAALVAVAGFAAWAEDAPEETVVATGEATFWLGGEEVAVASGELNKAEELAAKAGIPKEKVASFAIDRAQLYKAKGNETAFNVKGVKDRSWASYFYGK